MTKKPEKINWKETNLEFVGSASDRALKKESALHEPAWKKVLAANNPGLFVWRIENFQVVEWPKEKYGQFYSGDSYIVLNIYKLADNPQLLYDVHFWIGMHSTQDEYGTAAYKTVELDNLLDDRPVQHREVENYESAMFKSYFPTITYLKGGCPSGFRHVETHEYQSRLFHICGDRPKTLTIKEVKASRESLNSGDVFILDLGDRAYQWNGSTSSKDERFRAAQYLRELASSRNGRLTTEVLEEADDASKGHEFFQLLSHEPSKKTYKQQVQTGHEKRLYKLSDEVGKLAFSEAANGNFGMDHITEEDVWIIDDGQTLFVYVGEGASVDEKQNALIYAHNYLKDTNHPFVPVSVVDRRKQGKSFEEFKKSMAP